MFSSWQKSFTFCVDGNSEWFCLANDLVAVAKIEVALDLSQDSE